MTEVVAFLDHLYLDYVGRDSFYGFLASLRDQLFRDEDFSQLYCPDNGRDSVPPSLVATALLMQAYKVTFLALVVASLGSPCSHSLIKTGP